MTNIRFSPVRGARVQDRRSNSRINAKLLCRIEWEGQSRDAALLDISLSGALISTASGPPRGATVTLRLVVPEIGKPVAVVGTVVRGGSYTDDPLGPNRFGIRFHGISPDVLQLMRAKLNPGRNS